DFKIADRIDRAEHSGLHFQNLRIFTSASSPQLEQRSRALIVDGEEQHRAAGDEALASAGILKKTTGVRSLVGIHVGKAITQFPGVRKIGSCDYRPAIAN